MGDKDCGRRGSMLNAEPRSQGQHGFRAYLHMLIRALGVALRFPQLVLVSELLSGRLLSLLDLAVVAS